MYWWKIVYKAHSKHWGMPKMVNYSMYHPQDGITALTLQAIAWITARSWKTNEDKFSKIISYKGSLHDMVIETLLTIQSQHNPRYRLDIGVFLQIFFNKIVPLFKIYWWKNSLKHHWPIKYIFHCPLLNSSSKVYYIWYDFQKTQ